MSIKVLDTAFYLDDGTPYVWGYGDETTIPSNEVKIKPSDGGLFGKTVAIGSGRIVAGAYGDDDNGSGSGAAYIFNLNGTQLAKIKPSDGTASAFFGISVAVGLNRIVVGSYDGITTTPGAAYIFNFSGTQLAKIKGSDTVDGDYFGYSVSVGSNRIIAGAYGDDDNGSLSGSAYIFDLNGTQLAKIKPSDGAAGDFFGVSVAISSDRIIVGASGDDDNGLTSGSAYIFDLNGTQLAKIKPSDGAADDSFGASVAISSGRIVVGAINDDDNGSNSGAAYIFDLNGNQLAKIKPSDGAADDNFGLSVSISSGRIIVGSKLDDDNGSASGSAYVFDLNGTQIAKIKASDGAASDGFGESVAVGSGRIVVGASGDDDNGSNSGSAYIYKTPEVFTIYDAIEYQKGNL